jgi:hypothetical protein
MVEVNLQPEDYALGLVVIDDLYDAVLAHHLCRDPAARGASPLVENAQYVARLDHFWVRVHRAVIEHDERQGTEGSRHSALASQLSRKSVPSLGGAQCWNSDKPAQAQVPVLTHPKLRLIPASIPRISNLAQPSTVGFGPFVGDYGQPALWVPVYIEGHWLGLRAVDADNAATERSAALCDLDDAVAILGQPATNWAVRRHCQCR